MTRVSVNQLTIYPFCSMIFCFYFADDAFECERPKRGCGGASLSVYTHQPCSAFYCPWTFFHFIETNFLTKIMELGDTEIDILRKRLEETEAAMERIVKQMGSVSEHLSPTLLAQVLMAQGQGISQVRIPYTPHHNSLAQIKHSSKALPHGPNFRLWTDL